MGGIPARPEAARAVEFPVGRTMRFKLIVALLDDDKTDGVIDAGREAGATGATVITSVRGEGRKPEGTFFGLELTARRDIVLFVVAASNARSILESIRDTARFESKRGAGIAFQLDIEDAVGLNTQLPAILCELEDDK